MARVNEFEQLEQLPPEFRLVVACCVWPPGTHRNDRIVDALSSTLDWELLLKVVRRHRVHGLAADGLSPYVDMVPRSVIDALELSAAKHAREGLVLAGETFRLTRLLQAEGIRVACLKGSAVSIQAFGNLSLRYGRDIDLLVDRSDVLAADTLLHAAGYEITMPKDAATGQQKRGWMEDRKHFEYRHNNSGIQLELHWRLFDNRFLFSGELDLGTCSQVAISQGMTIPALNRRDLLLYLCVHGANHMWSRLKWIADLGALLSQNDCKDIPVLVEDACERGCLRSVSQALMLSHRLFNAPDTTHNFPVDSTTIKLMDKALNTMTRGKGGVKLEEIPFGTSLVAIDRYHLRSDWKFWLREAQLSSVDELDRYNAHLPRSLSFLLPFLRIPMWISRRVLHGGRSSR